MKVVCARECISFNWSCLLPASVKVGEIAFLFVALPDAVALAVPALGTSVQVVGRLVSCDAERASAEIEDAAAGTTSPAARLRLDTSLLPPDEVYGVLPRSTVHVFGTLLGAPHTADATRGGAAMDEEGSDSGYGGSVRVLRVVILRAVPDVDMSLLATTLRLRAAFLERMATLM